MTINRKNFLITWTDGLMFDHLNPAPEGRVMTHELESMKVTTW